MDGHGIADLLEYFLGLRPAHPDALSPPSGSIETDTFVFRFTLALNVNGLTYRVLSSNNLANWTPVSTAPLLVSSNATAETFSIAIPIAADTRLFARIEVTSDSAIVATTPIGVIRSSIGPAAITP